MHYLDANKTAGEEARRQLHKNVANNIEQGLVATTHKAPTVRPTNYNNILKCNGEKKSKTDTQKIL